jgi:TatA/E family protein of Tat protein translocase
MEAFFLKLKIALLAGLVIGAPLIMLQLWLFIAPGLYAREKRFALPFIILVIALIIFGPRKLPELGRSLGRSIGEFRRASNELRSTLEEEIRVEEQKGSAQKSASTSSETPTDPPAEPTAGSSSGTWR